MKTALTITTFDRPELFKKSLENLVINYPCGADYIFVYYDGKLDSSEADVFKNIVQGVSQSVVFCGGTENRGIAYATNTIIDHVFSVQKDVDVIIHIDSDCYVEQESWVVHMADFLREHPEVGMVAPDLPGRYMRINRPDYDEVEYALGMVWGARKDVLCDVQCYNGDGIFDRGIHHQFDPDLCYRIRMWGKRIALLDVGNAVDLGAGTGDSSRTSSTWRGGFEFLRKWNYLHLGFFNYKSPFCLTWNMFPLNFLWRKLWLAQFDLNEHQLETRVIQGHTFDMIRFPWDQGKWQLKQARMALEQDINFSGLDSFEKVSDELLSGKRHWEPKDFQK